MRFVFRFYKRFHSLSRSFAFYSSDESDKAGPDLALTRVTRGRRLTADSLRDIVYPHEDAEFYFCGPRNFLFDVR